MSLTKNNLALVRDLITSSKKFAIGVHARPDSDTMGSALALARALRQMGKSAVVLSQDGVPEVCSYLADVADVLTSTDESDFDVAVVCDADGLSRVGNISPMLQRAEKLLIIDHHVSTETVDPDGFSSFAILSDHTAAATAEIIYTLLDFMAVSIDSETANQLMSGIVGDTGGFRFANTSPRTFAIAANLTELGASSSTAAREIYESRTVPSTRLLGVALLNAKIEFDGKVVWSSISKADFDKYGATDSDTDSIVNHLRGVKGSLVGLLFREVDSNQVRVSLRSRNGVDVNKVARAFGGGGHVSASGCTIASSLEEAESAVLAEVRKWMAF